jgi:hypothetical protein
LYDSYFLVSILGGANLKISILKKDDTISNYLLDQYTEGYIIKKDFFNIILFIKVVVASIYAFGLGYSLFFVGDNFIKIGIKFLFLLIGLYIFIELPYALFKALLLPKVFNKDIIKLELYPFNMSISISSKKPVPKERILISLILPFLVFALIPTIASYTLEFDILLYAIASSSAIISVQDLIFFILLVFDNSIKGSLIMTPSEYIDSNINLNEISLDLNEDNNNVYKDEFCYQLLENIEKNKIKESLNKKQDEKEFKDAEYIKEMIFNIDEGDE